MSSAAPPVTREQNPWPGLFWYTEEQSHLFFGRQAETEELLRLIQRETLTILFGRSGLGKTSLLRAGVFPRLRRDGCFPVVLRLDYSPQAASLVDQVKALTEVAAHDAGIDIEPAPKPPASLTLWEYFHQTHFWGPRNDRLTPVLVFDQFEEIFTIGSRRHGDAGFLEQLADLAENRIPAIVQHRAQQSAERQLLQAGPPNYKIVLSLREDFVWRLDTLRPILPAIMRNRFALGPLDPARGLEIIRHAGGPWVSEDVAQDIVEAVISSRQGDSPGVASEELEPAYLNVMCNELFERMAAAGEPCITRDLVASEKGGILESLYARSLSGLDDSVRQFVEQHLVTPTGFRMTVPVEEARREQVSDADLEKLVDRRLLRFEDRLGTRHVELAHDLLTGLVQKSRDARNRARLRRQLRRARLRAVILGAIALAGFAATLSYWLAELHPSVSHYTSFMHGKGSIVPLGPLYGHHAQSLKVTRKGLLGEVLSIEAVDGSGNCMDGSQMEKSPFYSNAGLKQHFCQLQFNYARGKDGRRQLVHEVALDHAGNMVFTLFYVPQVNSDPNLQSAFVVGPDGTRLLSSFEIRYDSSENETEIRFLSGTGAFANRVIRIDRNNPKDRKQITGVRYFDFAGKPVAVNGCYAQQIRYDGSGNQLPPVCVPDRPPGG